MNKYIYVWPDGVEEVMEGDSAEDAIERAGYGISGMQGHICPIPDYSKNIEEFNQRIRKEIALKKEYLAKIERLESIYKRNGIEEGNDAN